MCHNSGRRTQSLKRQRCRCLKCELVRQSHLQADCRDGEAQRRIARRRRQRRRPRRPLCSGASEPQDGYQRQQVALLTSHRPLIPALQNLSILIDGTLSLCGMYECPDGRRTLLPGCASASSLMRAKRVGLGRCADAGPVVLMRSRLKDGCARLSCEDGMPENAALPLRSCIGASSIICPFPQQLRSSPASSNTIVAVPNEMQI